MSEHSDPIVGLRAYLLADDDVAELAGDDVFGGGIPEGLNETMPAPVVTLSPAGGAGIGDHTPLYGSSRVDVRSWGKTGYEASLLSLAVSAALRALEQGSYGGVKVLWARPASSGLALVDPDTGWPFVLSTWQVLVADTAT